MDTGAISKALSSSARSVSAIEFADAVFSTWKRHGPHEKRRKNVFGLAISGGVDSMALAALCSGIQQAPIKSILSGISHNNAQIVEAVLPHLKFQAFVVDHGVRDGSDVEARAVSGVLKQLGIQTQVLKIDWGSYERPAELPNFESLARKYRFQTLGKACRDGGIDSLFLAHHQDDQAETVLMRLINGHRMFGLLGMKYGSEIPECHGIYGVHESGGLDNMNNQAVSNKSMPPTQALKASNRPLGPLTTETGGVRVYRPLLGFTKNRLIATCKAASIEWFEDHTNKDPTVTTRNSIRHIYNSHAMPAALTAPSLLKLSNKWETKYIDHLNEANALLGGSIQSLKTRSGTISVNFPVLGHPNTSLSQSDVGLVAALLLRHVVQSVTPDEHVHLQSFHGSVSRVFPEISKDALPSRPTAFTVSGVQFKPLTPTSAQQRAGRQCGWRISRQPYPSTFPTPNIHIPPLLDPCRESPWTPWTLYDGRFWFRVQNRCDKSLSIRPFQEDDLKGFKKSLGSNGAARLRDILKELAPGDVRWTLPAIVAREADGNERVLALPTLEVSTPYSRVDVGWEVRYKKVDVEMLSRIASN